MEMLKRLFSALFSLALFAGLAFGVYHYRDEISRVFRQGVAEVAPCAVPIRYSIDRFDTDFGINRGDFRKILNESAAAWNKAVGKPVLSPQADGELQVSLIYDYRQQATDRLKKMGLDIGSQQESYDSLRSSYESQQSTVERDRAAYDQRSRQYEGRGQRYEAEVAKWNAKGGAPQSVFDRLNAEKEALDAEAQALKVQHGALNREIDSLNAMVTVLNRMATDLNLDAEQYNQTASARGETFQEGEYYRDYEETRINIYEFSGEEMLRRVLMHEFGHALGLGHLEQSGAVMYSLNVGEGSGLTAADVSAIRAVCGQPAN